MECILWIVLKFNSLVELRREDQTVLQVELINFFPRKKTAIFLFQRHTLHSYVYSHFVELPLDYCFGIKCGGKVMAASVVEDRLQVFVGVFIHVVVLAAIGLVRWDEIVIPPVVELRLVEVEVFFQNI